MSNMIRSFFSRYHQVKCFDFFLFISYRPSIEVSFLVSTLGFTDEIDCINFLKSIGVLPFLNKDKNPATGRKHHQFLDTKQAVPYVTEAGKKYQVIDIKGQI